MEDDGLGDWRHRAVTRLTKDVPAAYPGGPSHKAGTPVHLSVLVRGRRGDLIGFTAPSAAALALSISVQAAKKADILREAITFRKETTHEGTARGVPQEQASRLYDFFEQCMIAVTFSFNALEVFCNQTIADEVKDSYTRSTKRTQKRMTPDEVQRKLSTEEKLTSVLPALLGIDSPEEHSIWSDFKVLKRARDSTVHMKAKDAYTGGRVHKSSLFSEFFAMPSLMGFPIFAIGVIRFYQKPGQDEQRWLTHARELAGLLKNAKKPR